LQVLRGLSRLVPFEAFSALGSPSPDFSRLVFVNLLATDYNFPYLNRPKMALSIDHPL